MFEELNGKKYSIVYADPPWEYNNQNMYGESGRDTGGAKSHYPTMTDQDICDMPVSDILTQHAMLFMWVVSPKMPAAMDVGSSWGFEYEDTAFIWEKGVSNPGHYTMSSAELCLLFTKGERIEPAVQYSEYVFCLRGRHSEKPWIIRDNIARMYPQLNKIELFARNLLGSTEWDFWGNQSNGSNGIIDTSLDQQGTLFDVFIQI